MPRCQCIKNDGKQCSRDASIKSGQDDRFCWQHQKCSSPLIFPKIEKQKAQQIEKQKAQQIEKQKAQQMERQKVEKQKAEKQKTPTKPSSIVGGELKVTYEICKIDDEKIPSTLDEFEKSDFPGKKQYLE